MNFRKLLSSSAPRFSQFGPQTVIRRTKVNVWGTYGYSNFGHDAPDHFPLITKVFHFFVGSGILLGALDWDRFGPMLQKKYYMTKKNLGFDVPDQVIEDIKLPEERPRKNMEYIRNHRVS